MSQNSTYLIYTETYVDNFEDTTKYNGREKLQGAAFGAQFFTDGEPDSHSYAFASADEKVSYQDVWLKGVQKIINHIGKHHVGDQTGEALELVLFVCNPNIKKTAARISDAFKSVYKMPDNDITDKTIDKLLRAANGQKKKSHSTQVAIVKLLRDIKVKSGTDVFISINSANYQHPQMAAAYAQAQIKLEALPENVEKVAKYQAQLDAEVEEVEIDDADMPELDISFGNTGPKGLLDMMMQ